MIAETVLSPRGDANQTTLLNACISGVANLRSTIDAMPALGEQVAALHAAVKQCEQQIGLIEQQILCDFRSLVEATSPDDPCDTLVRLQKLEDTVQTLKDAVLHHEVGVHRRCCAVQ